MNRSNPLVLLALGSSVLLAAGAGFLAGRSSATSEPAGAETPTVRLIEEKRGAAASSSSAASNEAHAELPERVKKRERSTTAPITMAEIQSELQSMGVQPKTYRMDSLRAIADLQERVRASDVPEMAASMANASVPPKDDVFAFVMGTYAESDPQAAWKLAQGIKAGATRRLALSSVLSTVAESDPAQAFAFIDSIQDAKAKQDLTTSTLYGMAQKDPKLAWEYYRRTGGANNRNSHVSSTIFSSWADRDPEGAKMAAAQLSGSAAERAQGQIAWTIAQSDPQAAWNYAASLPLVGDRSRSPLVRVVESWAQYDPDAAIKAALSIREAGVRGSAVSTAVNTWAGNDFDAALRYTVNLKDSTMRADIFASMSHNDMVDRRQLLSAVLDHMPAGDSFQRTVSNIFYQWGQENPAAAAAALNELPQGRLLANAASQVARMWTRSDGSKQELLNWVRQLPEGEARRSAFNSVFQDWSGMDPQEALGSLQGLTGDDRKAAIHAIASGWSRSDPEAVLRWSPSIEDAGQRSDVIRNALGQWARFSPEAASSYFERLPAPQQEASMPTLVDQWASKDVGAAAEWLKRQPPTAAKDRAIETLSRKISAEDPATAIAWASTISDTSKRTGQVEKLVRDWIRQDGVNARAWVANSNLSPESRQRLLK